MRLHFLNSAVIANSKMDYSGGGIMSGLSKQKKINTGLDNRGWIIVTKLVKIMNLCF